MRRIILLVTIFSALALVSGCCDIESTCDEIADGTTRNDAYNTFCNAIEIDISAFSVEFIGPDGDSCRCDCDGSVVWDCRYLD